MGQQNSWTSARNGLWKGWIFFSCGVLKEKEDFAVKYISSNYWHYRCVRGVQLPPCWRGIWLCAVMGRRNCVPEPVGSPAGTVEQMQSLVTVG